MQTYLIIAILALAAGVAIGVTLQPDPDVQQSMTTVNSVEIPIVSGETGKTNSAEYRSAKEIAALERQLQDEIRARQALAQKVEEMSRQLAAISDESASIDEIAVTEPVTEDRDVDARSPVQSWFNEQALIDSGMDSSQANELKIYFEQLEMERLLLRDQSVRESWSDEKLRDSMQALESREDELKIQLGEAAYDAYLYASGQPNRVAVTSVLDNAQAGIAGIMSGDHIIRYDHQRIYNWLDLREAITRGDISDSVELEIERNGNTIQFYLDRGPLGIRMDSLRIAP